MLALIFMPGNTSLRTFLYDAQLHDGPVMNERFVERNHDDGITKQEEQFQSHTGPYFTLPAQRTTKTEQNLTFTVGKFPLSRHIP